MDRKTIEKKKNVVITGAFRGIGNMLCMHLINSFTVWPVCRTLTQAGLLKQSLQKTHKTGMMFHGDVRLESTTRKLAEAFDETQTIPYALVHCQGPVEYSENGIPEWQVWRNQIRDNLASSVLLTEMLSKKMRTGRIILFAFSGVGTGMGFRNISAYAAAKESVSVLARSAAKKLASDNVTVNVIAPGVFLTEKGRIPPRGNAMMPSIPMGRFGTPDDICGVVDWLLSPESAYVTGQIIKVSGGLHISCGLT